MSMCSLRALLLVSIGLIHQSWARKWHPCSSYRPALLPSRHCWGPNRSIVPHVDGPEIPSLLLEYAAMHKATLDGIGKRAGAHGLLILNEFDEAYDWSGVGNLFQVYQGLVLAAVWLRKVLLLRLRRPMRQFFLSPLGITWDYEDALQQSPWLQSLELDLDTWERGYELPDGLFSSNYVLERLFGFSDIEVISNKHTPMLLEAVQVMADNKNKSFAQLFSRLVPPDWDAADVVHSDPEFILRVRALLQHAVFGGWSQQHAQSVAELIREAAGGDGTWQPDGLKLIGIHLRTGQTEEVNIEELKRSCQEKGINASYMCKCLRPDGQFFYNVNCAQLVASVEWGAYRTRMIHSQLSNLWGAIIKLKRAVSGRIARQRRQSRQHPSDRQPGHQGPLWIVFVASNDVALMDECAENLNRFGEPGLRAVSLARRADISSGSFNTPFSGFAEAVEDWTLLVAADYIIKLHNISTFANQAALHGSKFQEHLVSHNESVYSFLEVSEQMQPVFNKQIRWKINQLLMEPQQHSLPRLRSSQ